MKILVLNGPNLNLLGIRERDIYGTESYLSLEKKITDHCRINSIECDIFQTNHEGVLVDKIQQALGVYDGIVINPAAYTHTSVAILDALKAVNIPTVEVHISDISQREDFRKISYISLAAIKTVSGHGLKGYLEAIDYLSEFLGEQNEAQV